MINFNKVYPFLYLIRKIILHELFNQDKNTQLNKYQSTTSNNKTNIRNIYTLNIQILFFILILFVMIVFDKDLLIIIFEFSSKRKDNDLANEKYHKIILNIISKYIYY